MVLVDTSVWISLYRRRGSEVGERLWQLVARNEAAICGQVWVEFIASRPIVRAKLTKGCDQARDVGGGAIVHYVNVEGGDRRSLDDGRNTANDDETDAMTMQRGEDAGEISRRLCHDGGSRRKSHGPGEPGAVPPG